ncbi:hypothetical protein FRC03_008148 [Tulasnella sp. 419]|nr:hypothetical protein FRC03_008148 [Tulasnella sp. 419]
MASVLPRVRSIAHATRQIRAFHSSNSRHAITQFTMPAMSPTMTEGGIASWKKKEGESFTTGDILLEIETDKATMDVEAQDDGVMGKIIVPDGSKSVPVGKLIALLAEEGDDISNLEVPAETEAPKKAESSSTPTPEPSSQSASPPPPPPAQKSASSESHSHALPHSSKPLFPSVLRLLQEHGLSDVDALGIKGTGVRGMITKGDILAHLGLASSAYGTYKPGTPTDHLKSGEKKETKEVKTILDGDAVRKLILSGMVKRVQPTPIAPFDVTFQSIIGEYYPPSPPKTVPIVPPATPKKAEGYFDGLI